jgi:hypothetical protein
MKKLLAVVALATLATLSCADGITGPERDTCATYVDCWQVPDSVFAVPKRGTCGAGSHPWAYVDGVLLCSKD